MHVNKKTEQTEKMRARLIKTGRKLFEKKGFEGVSAEEIVASAGVTRGALYHHFDGKEGLFAAVAEAAMDQLHQKISADIAAAPGSGTPRELVLASVAAFFERTADRRVQQLLFVDAPSVLGWSEWRASDAKFGLGALTKLIERGVQQEQFKTRQPKVSAHLLLSAMIEGAFLFAADPDDDGLRDALEANLRDWVEAL